MNEKCQRCANCGEIPILVTFNGIYFVRVRRISKCRRYVAPAERKHSNRSSQPCKTSQQPSAAAAIQEWNNIYGETGTDKPTN